MFELRIIIGKVGEAELYGSKTGSRGIPGYTFNYLSLLVQI